MKLERGFELVVEYTILLSFIGFALLPVVWMILTSIRTPLEYFSTPPTLLVRNPTLDNYIKFFNDIRFVQYFSNSLIIAVTSASLSTLISALAGYGFSRFEFKLKNILFISVVFCQMVPLMAIIMPLYDMMSRFKLIDNPLALVLSYFIITLPFSTWMCRAAFKQVPINIEEAALIDGCSRLKAIFSVVLPVAAPAMAAIFLYCFIQAWNEYVLAMTLINSTSKRTIQIGIMLYRGEY
ncbi:MAG: carbohydrate ABC transporter permease, partial [Nitrososphaeria archaeon]